MNSCTYIIVPSVEVTQAMVNACLETSIGTLRHTTEGEDLVVLKWDGPTPPSLLSYTQYSHSEIITEMQQPEWNEVESSSLGE